MLTLRTCNKEVGVEKMNKRREAYGGFVADDEAAGVDACADGHFGALDVDEALETGVAGLRVRQVLGLEHQLAGHSARHQHVLHVRRPPQTRAVAGAVRHQVRRILKIPNPIPFRR